MERCNNDYWYNQWHLDTELHKKMNLKNVRPIPQTTPVSIYADTDSVHKDTIIRTGIGSMSIEDLYNLGHTPLGNTLNGHESVNSASSILNWSKDKELYYAEARRIIRHKVSKPKWKLKTKSGKEIIVTNDHSMVVFRDGNQLTVKPSEILKTDKILVIKD